MPTTERVVQLLQGSELARGAREASIRAAQEKLKKSLPEDYLAFIAHANGAKGLWGELYPLKDLPTAARKHPLGDAPGLILIGAAERGDGFVLAWRDGKPGYYLFDLGSHPDGGYCVGDTFEEFLARIVDFDDNAMIDECEWYRVDQLDAPPPVAAGEFGLAAELGGDSSDVNKDIMEFKFSPDSRLVASIASGNSQDDTVRIWDVETKKPLHVFSAHSGRSLDFSADGRWLATCHGRAPGWKDGQTIQDPEQAICIWDLVGGTLAARTPTAAWPVGVRFIHGTDRLLVKYDLFIELWSLNPLQRERVVVEGRCPVKVSPNGQAVVVSRADRLQIIDSADWRIIAEIPQTSTLFGTNPDGTEIRTSLSVGFSITADSRRLFVAGELRTGRTCDLYDMATGARIETLKLPKTQMWAAALLPSEPHPHRGEHQEFDKPFKPAPARRRKDGKVPRQMETAEQSERTGRFS